MNKVTSTLVIASAALLSVRAIATNTISYRFVPLPASRHGLTLLGQTAVTDRGDILMSARNDEAQGYAILRNNGFIFTQLELDGHPRSMNNQGTLVGEDDKGAFFVENDWPQRHFRAFGQFTQVYGINFRNEMCGSYGGRSALNQHGFYGRLGAFKSFDVPNAITTTVTGISGIGAICGTFERPFGSTHGFYMLKRFEMLDYPGAALTEAVGVNNLGAVLGHYVTAQHNGTRPVIYAGGEFFDVQFPAPPSQTTVSVGGVPTVAILKQYDVVPFAINDYGMIVGRVTGSYLVPGSHAVHYVDHAWLGIQNTTGL
jgi:hypothetical protein